MSKRCLLQHTYSRYPKPMNKFPMAVVLEDKRFGNVRCIGAIISLLHVLIPTICYYNYEFVVRVGGPGSDKVYDVKEVVIHGDKMLAILTLKEKIDLGVNVSRVCIPSNNLPPLGSDVLAVGTNGDVNKTIEKYGLNHYILKTQPNQPCSDHFPSIHDKTMVCTRGYDDLLDDRGGLLMWRDDATQRYFLMGLLYYRDNYQVGININTTTYIQWIKQKVQGQDLCTNV